MPQESELLNAVLEKPDDDAPRLAYAGWCAEQSEPAMPARAAMIRLQLAAHRLGQMSGGPAAEARELIKRHQAHWIGGLARFVVNVEFYRGFIECVTATARNWVESSAKIRRLAPVRHLDLVDVGERLAEVFQSGSMEGIRSLSLKLQGVVDGDVRLLANSRHLGSLRWLSLVGNRVTEAGAYALAESTRLPALHWVNFYENPFDPGEKYAHDQGVVVDSWLPPEGVAMERRFGRLQWLHHPAKNLWDTEPNRFTLE